MLSIEQALTYQQLGPVQVQRYENILVQARGLAATITSEFPGTTTEVQQALANLAQCVMWTQIAIAGARSGTQNAARSGTGAG